MLIVYVFGFYYQQMKLRDIILSLSHHYTLRWFNIFKNQVIRGHFRSSNECYKYRVFYNCFFFTLHCVPLDDWSEGILDLVMNVTNIMFFIVIFTLYCSLLYTHFVTIFLDVLISSKIKVTKEYQSVVMSRINKLSFFDLHQCSTDFYLIKTNIWIL